MEFLKGMTSSRLVLQPIMFEKVAKHSKKSIYEITQNLRNDFAALLYF